MKSINLLKRIIGQNPIRRVRFGCAEAVFWRDGSCEILGGSASDHQEVLEWLSLFEPGTLLVTESRSNR